MYYGTSVYEQFPSGNYFHSTKMLGKPTEERGIQTESKILSLVVILD